MAHTRKPAPAHTAGPYKIRRGEIWAVGDPSDKEEVIGTVFRAEGWTEGEPIRTEDQANAAFIVRAMNSHDDLLAALRESASQHETSAQQFAYYAKLHRDKSPPDKGKAITNEAQEKRCRIAAKSARAAIAKAEAA